MRDLKFIIILTVFVIHVACNDDDVSEVIVENKISANWTIHKFIHEYGIEGGMGTFTENTGTKIGTIRFLNDGSGTGDHKYFSKKFTWEKSNMQLDITDDLGTQSYEIEEISDHKLTFSLTQSQGDEYDIKKWYMLRSN